LIGDQVTILDCDFHEISPITRMNGVGPIEPVVIGDNVWLGSRVMVLKGVTIGENSVVAAMSVVTKSIPPNSIAVGNPARVIRSIG
jgi:maltose O-acetyltransferase